MWNKQGETAVPHLPSVTRHGTTRGSLKGLPWCIWLSEGLRALNGSFSDLERLEAPLGDTPPFTFTILGLH